MEDSYKPINCDLYDTYIMMIEKKQKVIILHSDGEEITGLVDIFTKDKVEYLKTLEGKVIRLDKIINIKITDIQQNKY